jgi:hypothetical protein
MTNQPVHASRLPHPLTLGRAWRAARRMSGGPRAARHRSIPSGAMRFAPCASSDVSTLPTEAFAER